MAIFTSFIKSTKLELNDDSSDRAVNEKLVEQFIQSENKAAMLMDTMAKETHDADKMVQLDMELAALVENMEDTIMQLSDEYHEMFEETGEENENQAMIHDFFMNLVEDIAARYFEAGLKDKGYFYSWVKHFFTFQDKEIESVIDALDAAFGDIEEEKIKKYTFKYRGAKDTTDLVMDLVTPGDFDLAFDVVKIDGSHKAFYDLIEHKSEVKAKNGFSKNLELAIDDIKSGMVNLSQELEQQAAMDGDDDDRANIKNMELAFAFIGKWVNALKQRINELEE